MDNTFYLRLLAETHQERLFEERGQTRLLQGQPRLANPAVRQVIMTSGGFLVRAGEALKGIGVSGETPRLPSNGPTVSMWNNSSSDV